MIMSSLVNKPVDRLCGVMAKKNMRCLATGNRKRALDIEPGLKA